MTSLRAVSSAVALLRRRSAALQAMRFPAPASPARLTTTLVLVWCSASTLATAAPFVPAHDAEVVETLPAKADPAVRRVDSLRKQLAARPADAALRVDIARRYFDLAMAQGDPRYVGYAAAALQPLASANPAPPGYWLVHGMLRQYGHDFEGALQSLDKAAQADPASGEPHAWRAAIFMVQARYPEALQACQQLAPLAAPLAGAGCSAHARAAHGQLAPSYAALTQALAAAPGASAELLLWQRTRLAEMALRLQRPAEAEGHLKAALQLGVTDQFLLGAYADFLLDQQRPAEVVKLLQGWERSDVLLLRLALAGQMLQHPEAANWARQLRERFAAAAQRGDRLHEQEAARFALDIDKQPAQALALAQHNYTSQKEPRDAEVLMRAALAAGQPGAAQPALDWLRSSRHEDPRLQRLANQLAAAAPAQGGAK